MVGGVNATFMWRELLKDCPPIDYVLRGYAQPGLRALLNNLSEKKDEPVPGLAAYRRGEYFSENITAITRDDLVFPLPGGIDVDRYLEWTKVYPLLTHTGCGFSCNFCTSVMPGPYQNKEVYREPEDIVAEMRTAVELGFERFFMSANIFTSKPTKCLELCNAIKEAKLQERASWVCMTRVELVNPDLLKAMRQAGCVNIAFGVESVGKSQWTSLNKGRYSDDTVYRAFDLTKEAGIETTSYLMLGAPDQSAEDIEETIDVVREINPDYRVISFFQPFPGTPYWESPERYGLEGIAPLAEWNFHEAPICSTKHMSKPELFDAAVRLYLDRGGTFKLKSATDVLENVGNSTEFDEEAPEAARRAFSSLNAGKSVSDVLEDVAEACGTRGRLIALYWLSSGLRDGSLKIKARFPSSFNKNKPARQQSAY